jgi:hypothetical protein
LWYVTGTQPAILGINHATHESRGSDIREDDGSRFDSAMSATTDEAEAMIMLYAYGFPDPVVTTADTDAAAAFGRTTDAPMLSHYFSSWRSRVNTRGVTSFGQRFRAPFTRASGDTSTTTKNSTQNGCLHAYAYAAVGGAAPTQSSHLINWSEADVTGDLAVDTAFLLSRVHDATAGTVRRGTPATGTASSGGVAIPYVIVRSPNYTNSLEYTSLLDHMATVLDRVRGHMPVGSFAALPHSLYHHNPPTVIDGQQLYGPPSLYVGAAALGYRFVRSWSLDGYHCLVAGDDCLTYAHPAMEVRQRRATYDAAIHTLGLAVKTTTPVDAPQYWDATFCSMRFVPVTINNPPPGWPATPMQAYWPTPQLSRLPRRAFSVDLPKHISPPVVAYGNAMSLAHLTAAHPISSAYNTAVLDYHRAARTPTPDMKTAARGEYATTNINRVFTQQPVGHSVPTPNHDTLAQTAVLTGLTPTDVMAVARTFSVHHGPDPARHTLTSPLVDVAVAPIPRVEHPAPTRAPTPPPGAAPPALRVQSLALLGLPPFFTALVEEYVKTTVYGPVLIVSEAFLRFLTHGPILFLYVVLMHTLLQHLPGLVFQHPTVRYAVAVLLHTAHNMWCDTNLSLLQAHGKLLLALAGPVAGGTGRNEQQPGRSFNRVDQSARTGTNPSNPTTITDPARTGAVHQPMHSERKRSEPRRRERDHRRGSRATRPEHRELNPRAPRRSASAHVRRPPVTFTKRARTPAPRRPLMPAVRRLPPPILKKYEAVGVTPDVRKRLAPLRPPLARHAPAFGGKSGPNMPGVSVGSVEHKMISKGLRISMREYFSDIVTTDVFSSSTAIINPMNEELFPWLSLIASRFSSYVWEKCRFGTQPTTGTDVAGTNAIAITPDPDRAPPTDMNTTLNIEGAVGCAAWDGASVDALKPSADVLGPSRFCADVTGATDSGLGNIFDDLRTVSNGILTVASAGYNLLSVDSAGRPFLTPSAAPGLTELTTGKAYTEYTIILADPIITEVPDDGIDFVATSNPGGSNAWGSSTTDQAAAIFETVDGQQYSAITPGELINPLRSSYNGEVSNASSHVADTTFITFPENGRYLLFAQYVASSFELTLNPGATPNSGFSSGSFNAAIVTPQTATGVPLTPISYGGYTSCGSTGSGYTCSAVGFTAMVLIDITGPLASDEKGHVILSLLAADPSGSNTNMLINGTTCYFSAIQVNGGPNVGLIRALGMSKPATAPSLVRSSGVVELLIRQRQRRIAANLGDAKTVLAQIPDRKVAAAVDRKIDVKQPSPQDRRPDIRRTNLTAVDQTLAQSRMPRCSVCFVFLTIGGRCACEKVDDATINANSRAYNDAIISATMRIPPCPICKGRISLTGQCRCLDAPVAAKPAVATNTPNTNDTKHPADWVVVSRGATAQAPKRANATLSNSRPSPPPAVVAPAAAPQQSPSTFVGKSNA